MQIPDNWSYPYDWIPTYLTTTSDESQKGNAIMY